MELKDECRQRVIECLVAGLQEVVFGNRFSLDYSSFHLLDSCARPLPRRIEDLATNWISPDRPLTNFSYDFIAENRSSYSDKLRKLSPEDFPVRLSDLTDITQVAVQIVDAFVTLPWEYSVALPQEAGQWYFASATERNEIFEFVEAVVVLEILFNDQATAGDVGIQKLIANRCAYLTASSTSERQDIIKKVNAIYDARSKIVHKGKGATEQGREASADRGERLRQSLHF